MYFNGLRILVAGSGVDVPMGTFTDGQLVRYDQANNVLSGTDPVVPNSVLQVIRTQSAVAANTTTILPADNTIPQNTEGAAYASLDTTITPKFATSRLVIAVTLSVVTY